MSCVICHLPNGELSHSFWGVFPDALDKEIVDDHRELETWAPGIRLLEEYYFTDDPDLARLNLGYRVAYRLAGAFKIVQRAHRIVYYQL